MKNIFDNKSNNQNNPNKTIIQSIDEFFRRVSNLVAVTRVQYVANICTSYAGKTSLIFIIFIYQIMIKL